MYLQENEKNILIHAICLEMNSLTTILAEKNNCPSESIARFENRLNVLTSALQQLNDFIIIEFDEIQSYHIRYAIALRLTALMDGLLSDELMTDIYFDLFKDEVYTLLNLYKRLQ